MYQAAFTILRESHYSSAPSIDQGIRQTRYVDNRVETAEFTTVGRPAKIHVSNEVCKTPDGYKCAQQCDINLVLRFQGLFPISYQDWCRLRQNPFGMCTANQKQTIVYT
jgi:hypothetical protein